VELIVNDQHRPQTLGLVYAVAGWLWGIDGDYARWALDALDGMDLDAHVREFQVRQRSSEAPTEPAYYQNVGGTAVIPIIGAITKRPTSFGDLFGEAAIMTIQKGLSLALKDDSVHSVLLQIESPGGEMTGVADLADAIYKANDVKRVVSFGDGMMASAAYYLGSQAGTVLMDQGGWTGSMGVYTVLQDYSKMYEDRGIDTYVVKSGDFKGIGVRGSKITEKQRNYMQDRVNVVHNQFVNAVARGRNLKPEQVSKLADGKSFIAADALKRKLIDGISTFDCVLEAVNKAAQSPPDDPKEKGMADKNFKERVLEAIGMRGGDDDGTEARTPPSIILLQENPSNSPNPTDPAQAAVALDTEPVVKAELESLRARAKLGDEYVAHLREETESQFIRAYGQDALDSETKKAIAEAPVPVLRTMHDSARRLADAGFGITDTGGSRQTASRDTTTALDATGGGPDFEKEARELVAKTRGGRNGSS
jgi:signal peptide peptidase SppA